MLNDAKYCFSTRRHQNKIETIEGKTFFMYLRALLCTFQISVDFYYVPVGGRGGGRGGAGEGGARERGIEYV